jgi:L-ascorbate 6-phosphate lactonase
VSGLLNDQTHVIRVQFLGQSGLRIAFGGAELLVDPYLSNALAQGSDEPALWQRAFAPPVQPRELRAAVAVLCTHEHADHADPETIEGVLRASPQCHVLLPAAARAALAGVAAPERLTATRGDGDEHCFGPYRVRAVPAAHSRAYATELDADGHRWQGFVVEVGGRRIYHSGDTVAFEGQVEAVCARGPIDCAILPVNGRDPYRERHDVIGNLWPREAVELATELGAATLIPVHHDLFAFNGIAVGQVADYAVQRGAPLEVRCLSAGAWTELPTAGASDENEGGIR